MAAFATAALLWTQLAHAYQRHGRFLGAHVFVNMENLTKYAARSSVVGLGHVVSYNGALLYALASALPLVFDFFVRKPFSFKALQWVFNNGAAGRSSEVGARAAISGGGEARGGGTQSDSDRASSSARAERVS